MIYLLSQDSLAPRTETEAMVSNLWDNQVLYRVLEPQNEENDARVPHHREQPVLPDDEKPTFSGFRKNVLSNWNETSQPASLIWNNLGLAGSIFCDMATSEWRDIARNSSLIWNNGNLACSAAYDIVVSEGKDIARNASLIWNNGQLAWSAACEIPGAYVADRMNLLYHKPIDGILTIATDVLPLFSIGGTIVGKTTSVTEILSGQTAKKAPIILSSVPKRLLWSTKGADASFGYNSAVKPWVASVGKSGNVVQKWTRPVLKAEADVSITSSREIGMSGKYKNLMTRDIDTFDADHIPCQRVLKYWGLDVYQGNATLIPHELHLQSRTYGGRARKINLATATYREEYGKDYLDRMWLLKENGLWNSRIRRNFQQGIKAHKIEFPERFVKGKKK
jgi:hypothetical protein